jgi:hypothetical protein
LRSLLLPLDIFDSAFKLFDSVSPRLADPKKRYQKFKFRLAAV